MIGSSSFGGLRNGGVLHGLTLVKSRLISTEIYSVIVLLFLKSLLAFSSALFLEVHGLVVAVLIAVVIIVIIILLSVVSVGIRALLIELLKTRPIVDVALRVVMTLVTLVVVRKVSSPPRVLIFTIASLAGAKGMIESPLLRGGNLALFLGLLFLDVIVFAEVLCAPRSDIPQIILIIAALLAILLGLLSDKERGLLVREVLRVSSGDVRLVIPVLVPFVVTRLVVGCLVPSHIVILILVVTLLCGDNFLLATLGPLLFLAVVVFAWLSLVGDDSAVVAASLDGLESLIGTDGHA